MWFDEAGEVLEMFRNSFPYSFLFFLPILIVISPVSPVGAAHEFAVYRMQQYDLQGSSYGCRNTLVNVEARPIESSMYTRKCMISRLREFTMDKFKDMVSQNAAGLLLLLPEDLGELSTEDSSYLADVEQELLQEETQLPVFFTHETPQLLEIYKEIQTSDTTDQAKSATEALMSSASANGFQLIVNGPAGKSLGDFQVVNLQGKLPGCGIEEQLPTITLVAHYDAFGVAPSLSRGADSNGSGVVALLELARLFKKLYSNSRTHAKYNLLFLLSGAGKYNYQGTRRWIEDQLEGSEPSMLADASYVLCLDGLGTTNNLNFHVSKPPKDGSAGDILFKSLQDIIREFHPEVNFNIVHKKINLADDYLAWEHERFSIRRLPAFTLSHHDNHKQFMRNSILDTIDKIEYPILVRNVKIIAETMARHIFNLSAESTEIFNDGMKVERKVLSAWLEYLGSQPRSAQLLDKNSQLVQTLEEIMNKYLKDVKRHTFRADKRDPEFMFFSGSDFTMYAYNVKPAVFDLFLALGIAGYLAVLYLVVQNFSFLMTVLRSFTTNKPKKLQ